MYGFWRLGVSPSPSKGAICVRNGLAVVTSRNAKNVATAAITGTTQTTRSWWRRLSSTAAAPYPVRTRSQRRSQPSWPPQKELSVYGHGSERLVWAEKKGNGKSGGGRA